MDVLFRYLNVSITIIKILSSEVTKIVLKDTSASPLYQTFVEIENPYATGISFDINFHQVMSLELTFSGVPTKRKINSKNNQINGQEGSEDESEEDEEDENEEEEEEMEESEEEEEEMEEHEKDSSNIQDLM